MERGTLEALLRRYAPPNSPLQTLLITDDTDAGLKRGQRQDRAYAVTLPWSEFARFSSPSGVPSLPADWASAGRIGGLLILGLRLNRVDPFGLARISKAWLMPKGCLVLSAIALAKDGLPIGQRVAHLNAALERCGFVVLDSTTETSGRNRSIVSCTLRRREDDSALEIGDLADIAFADFRCLFREAFSDDYEEALWSWKYAQGRGRAVVAKRAGRLVAFYGSTERAISYFGRRGTAVQICDVMVTPKERGILTRRGAMFCTGAAFAEAFLAVEDHTIGYGFPTTRHMLLGRKVSLYEEVAKMVELRWAALDTPATSSSLRLRPIDPASEAGVVSHAWKRMRASLTEGICVVRDADYLRYRYLEHPVRNYSIFCVRKRLSPIPLGLIVLRPDGAECELLDVVAPLKHLHSLIIAAKQQAQAFGCSQLYGWISDGYAHALVDDGAEVRELGVSVPTSLWVKREPTDRLAGKWFVMAGDTEFR